ncbi:MAG: hypothetical protein HYT64_00620 [Candidatus Yanofskybacteria bacterium]|nr:hypothetical protein [Candidatus Yanofskybacteria bacterium]
MKSYAVVSSVSKSANGKHAQVTVVTGEGRNRRSFTRHVESRGYHSWVGLNIDPRAIPLNKLYEQELAEAKSELFNAEAAVRNLEKKLENIDKSPEGDIITESMLLAAYVALDEQLEIAQDDVCVAAKSVDDAKTKLDIVRREVPLEIEFTGPGLTY